MDDTYPNTADAEALAAADRSLTQDLRLLATDARTLAEAELAYQKSRAATLGSGIGKIAGLGAVAVLLVFLALVALAVGLVFALSPILTAWGATAVVTGVLLVLAVVVALWARSSWSKLSMLLNEGTAP